jgi:S-adenosyl methyltransferase
MRDDDPAERAGGHSGDWRKTFRPDIPSPARIYDYLLGGKDNYPADRQAGDEILSRLPNSRQAARWNRSFLQRAVRFLVNEAGIRQLIDIGTGLPSAGNVHEVARENNVPVRIVYVDNDPVVLVHGRDMLHGVPDTVILEHDLRAPGAILADPGLQGLIDFGEPVGILLIAILHFISDDDDPAGIIEELLRPFPAGSYLVLSHATQDAIPEVSETARNVYDEATARGHVRRRDEVLALVRGLDLIEPGMVWVPQWHRGPGTEIPAHPEESYGYALVARKPRALRM